MKGHYSHPGSSRAVIGLQCSTLNYSLLTGVLPCTVSSLPSLTAAYFCIDIAGLQSQWFFGVTKELGVGNSVGSPLWEGKKCYLC